MTREDAYEAALHKIASFKEHLEDYYGGVSINYSAMLNDIINIAAKALTEQPSKRVRCEIQNGCCEPCLETAYQHDFNHLKKAIESGDKDE